MTSIDIVGYIAAIFGTGMALPQLIKIIETKHAADVSILMFEMNLIATALWFLYGLLSNSLPILVANIVAFIFSLTIIILKLKYDRKKP